MDSHLDSDARSTFMDEMRKQAQAEFMTELERKAARIKAEARSKITGGAPGEKSLAEWEHGSVHVRQLPNDEQGILRISIGGGENLPVNLNYCVFRGDLAACAAMLRKALGALESHLNNRTGL